MVDFIKKQKKYFFIGAVLFFVCLTAGYIMADWQGGTAINNLQVSSRDGLVAYWTMDSNDMNGTAVYDKSGNGNNGVSNNTPSMVSGKIKEAMSFNGSSDYIQVSRVTDFAWGTTKNFTISLWFYAGSTYTGLGSMVDADNATPRWELGVNASNLLYAQAHDGTKNATPTIINPSDGQWHHLVAVFNRAGSLTLYLDVDTTSAASMALVTGSLTVNDKLSIGRNEGGNNYFKDLLDDVRIYNKALTVGEITNLYNATKINYVQSAPRNGLVGYWNMDENDSNGSVVYDKSGNDYNGTKTGSGGSNNTPQNATGKLKEALNFDGTDDYIELPDLTETSAGTFAVWVKPQGSIIDEANLNMGLMYGGSTVDGSIIMRWYDSDGSGALDFYISDAGGWVNSRSTTNVWNDGEWYFITGTWDGVNMSLYVNGVLEDSDAQGSPSVANTTWRIGQSANGLDYYYFSGAIDEARLYDRALSANEVKQLYDAAKINYIK
ncbi:MAG: hypothetical protein COU31_03880 [Candidatus Magasanikbacteria bacterium CG10_big_fil_rev_8_21_14_0_10_40_10]|uniref:LamG-like jellyroll fold domain-containing protein n=1 Tax=Candidatus Magasanikbacteria bacterium CG10_big_fil_rev_8_21_14_0_10_40_10 TaxID=1974648 RepID=A0A2M6W3E7_9BACT|nr:MAG: hypothetical protein COU31_03880 [Candidatus Magasanikbacteria bacterium CG10_big_fil_rev_8_21_14_0_10_40_10]